MGLERSVLFTESLHLRALGFKGRGKGVHDLRNAGMVSLCAKKLLLG
jgi:hypothetical protein